MARPRAIQERKMNQQRGERPAGAKRPGDKAADVSEQAKKAKKTWAKPRNGAPENDLLVNRHETRGQQINKETQNDDGTANGEGLGHQQERIVD